MEHNEIVVNKLDRPVLKNNVKIHGPEKFQLNPHARTLGTTINETV